jgi:hypothetical protein
MTRVVAHREFNEGGCIVLVIFRAGLKWRQNQEALAQRGVATMAAALAHH